MKMKRTVSFLLVLVMLFTLLAGCGQQGGETQSGTKLQGTQATQETTQAPTEPEVKEPPRTAAEFMDLFFEELAVQGVSAVFGEFYEQPYGGDEGGKVGSSYLVFADNGTEVPWGSCVLNLYYPKTIEDPLREITIHVNPDATEAVYQIYPAICKVVSMLCDVNMTEQTLATIFSEDLVTKEYITYTGDVGTYRIDYIGNGIPSRNVVSFSQPMDLTHTLTRYPDHYQFRMEYQIAFTEAGEKLHAYNEPPMTVAELESPDAVPFMTVSEMETVLNAYFAAEGIPIECAFEIAGSHDRYPYKNDTAYNMGSITWTSCFRFTGFDDPDFPYPDPYMDSRMSKTDSQRNAVLNYAEITLEAKGYYSSSPISAMEASINAVTSYPEVVLPYLIQGVCTVWDEKMGEDTLSAFVSSAQTTQWEEEYHLDTDMYSLCYEYSEYDGIPPIPYFRATYHPISDLAFQPPADPLDPVLLDCKYTFSDSFVRDGVFNYNVHPTDIFTADMGVDEGDETQPSELFERYLRSTGSAEHNTYLGYDWEVPDPSLMLLASDYPTSLSFDNEAYLYQRFNDGIYEYEPVDCGSFGTIIYSFDKLQPNDYRQMYAVYYNESVESQVDPVDAIRLAVGLGQILDESLTVEDAIALQKKEMTPTASYKKWEGASFCPGEVMHIVCQNTVTGQTVYYILPKGIFDTYYKDLNSFMADGCALFTFEYISGQYSSSQ